MSLHAIHKVSSEMAEISTRILEYFFRYPMEKVSQVLNFLPEARVESLLQPLPDLIDRSDHDTVDPHAIVHLSEVWGGSQLI